MKLLLIIIFFITFNICCTSSSLKCIHYDSNSTTINDDNCITYTGNDSIGFNIDNYCFKFTLKYNSNMVWLNNSWNEFGRLFEAKFGLMPVKSTVFNDSVLNNILIEVFDKKQYTPFLVEMGYIRLQQKILEYRQLNGKGFYKSFVYLSNWENKRELFKGIISIYENDCFVYRITYVSTESTFDQNLINYKFFENNFQIY